MKEVDNLLKKTEEIINIINQFKTEKVQFKILSSFAHYNIPNNIKKEIILDQFLRNFIINNKTYVLGIEETNLKINEETIYSISGFSYSKENNLLDYLNKKDIKDILENLNLNQRVQIKELKKKC